MFIPDGFEESCAEGALSALCPTALSLWPSRFGRLLEGFPGLLAHTYPETCHSCRFLGQRRVLRGERDGERRFAGTAEHGAALEAYVEGSVRAPQQTVSRKSSGERRKATASARLFATLPSGSSAVGSFAEHARHHHTQAIPKRRVPTRGKAGGGSVPRGCVELAGESPVAVMTKQPRS